MLHVNRQLHMKLTALDIISNTNKFFWGWYI